MVVVSATAILMPMVSVGMLHIPAATALGDDTRMVGSLHGNASASVQAVTDIHVAAGIVHVSKITAGPPLNRAIRCVGFSDARRFGREGGRFGTVDFSEIGCGLFAADPMWFVVFGCSVVGWS